MNSKEIEEVKLTKKFARIIEPERQVLLKKVTYDKAIKCAQVAAEYRSIGEREAAIGFATWMEDGNFYRSVENGIRYYHKTREEKYTKEQLYEIYAKSLLNQQGEETCDAMGHFGGAKPEGICGKCNKEW